MDEIKNFEASLKIYNKKKQFALYSMKEKHPSGMSSKVLYPQDVITMVSKQLRDIQKADSVKKGRVTHFVKSRQSNFIPISVVNRQEGIQHQHVTKFETQCISDTQLVDIVENVEAMNVDQVFQTTSFHKEGSPEEKTTEKNITVSLCGVNNIITENNVTKNLEDNKELCNQKDALCINDINTDIYKEFDISYSKTQIDNLSSKNSERIMNTSHSNSNKGLFDLVDTNESFANKDKDGTNNSSTIDLNLNVHKHEKKRSSKEKYNKKLNLRKNQREDKITFKIHDNTTKELGLTKEHFPNRFCLESNIENDCRLLDEKEFPSSPIFKSFKTTVKPKPVSPLVFPLDLFEIFEAVAMPLMEENIDFEVTKYLINSQIMDNQLNIAANIAPVPKKPTDFLLSEINNSKKKMIDLIPDKDNHIRTSKNSQQVVNKFTRFEDEILFTSDEENEYFHHRQKDLPLTCASKTLFHESQIDLDETIFVGFQTSSDKCIQVSKESFIKAKNIFESIDKQKNTNVTLTELVDIYDSKTSHFNNNLPSKQISNKDISGNNERVNKVTNNFIKTIISENNSVKDFEKGEFAEFQIANEKAIDISEMDVPICNTVFKNVEEAIVATVDRSNLPTKKQEFIEFKTASNKIIKISEEFLSKPSNVFKDIDLNLNNPVLETQINKNIDQDQIQSVEYEKGRSQWTDFMVKTKVNEDYKNIVDQTLLQEFEIESIDETKNEHNQIDSDIVETFVKLQNTEIEINKSCNIFANDDDLFNGKDLVNLDPGIPEHYNNIPHVKDTSKLFVFKTNNNKEVKVSNKALAKTKDFFHDEMIFDDFTLRCNFLESDVRKDENISKTSFAKWASSETKFQQPNCNIPQSCFSGFRTASNKMVQISKQALMKSEKIFQDIDSITICEDHRSIKCERDLNDPVKFSNKSINKDNSFSFQGFKTANNKVVNVSKEALVKTNKIIQDMFKDIDVQYARHIGDVKSVEVTNPNVYIRNRDKETHLSNDSNCHDIASNFDKILNHDIDPVYEIKGNLNNKPVTNSKQSSLKIGKMFENANDIYNHENFLLETAKCVNLNTPSEKCDINKCIENTVTSNILGFPGFKTASNKNVVISEDALAKTKNLFKDVDCEIPLYCHKNENEKSVYLQTSVEYLSKNTFKIPTEGPKRSIGSFVGFQTASNKRVNVSDQAVARSRKIFDEINFEVENMQDKVNRDTCLGNEDMNKENVEKRCEKNDMRLTFGFKTATNKYISVSEDLLKQSKKIFSEFGNEFTMTNKRIDILSPRKVSAINTENNSDLHNTIDTQLLNDFEETLHTEDFYKDKTPKQFKRSGSPILSCPKAKKRKKFETPYKSDISAVNNMKAINIIAKTSDMKYVFSKNYKKTKSYCLKTLENTYKNKLSEVIDPYILKFDFETLLNFEFYGSRNDFKDVRWKIDDIKSCFIESVDNKIIPTGWLDNHLKLILWKLLSYEIRFPYAMEGACSVRNVLEQLKYRYDRELHRVQRPALRKLLEKDEISTRTLILVVVGVYVDGVKVQTITSASSNVELLVSDGWYCVKASTDRMISRLICDGKIPVGTKIATVGAELLNCEQGMSPWEDTSAVRLKLFGNSTRPARWDARLGFHSNGAILSPLSTIDPSGGKVCKTRALVLRVYPALYVEKLEDGSTVTRSERLEHLYQVKYEGERQNQLEKLYEEVEKEFFEQESSESEGTDIDLKKSHQSGSQLNRLMKKCNDPSQFRSHLTDSQELLLQEYSSKKKEKIVEELQKRVHDKIRAQDFHLSRNVIPLLKVKVAAFEGTDGQKISKAAVSIWRPNDAILDVVKEGIWIDMFNVVPTSVRYSEIQISAGRQSVFHRSKYKEKDKMKPYIESLQRKCFTTKDLNINPTIQTDLNEVDTVGLVFLIEPSLNDFETIKGQPFQNVYLTDINKHLICINFWGGIKKFGYENIFENGNIVACLNLQKRAGNTRKNIPQYRATELTVFTKTPKLDHVRNITEELLKKMSGLDKKKFCNDCVVIKNNYTTIKHHSEISPYRCNVSDYSLTKNKIFIDSPLAQNKDVNLNLTGLDFESTFQQTDSQELSPTTLKRKQLVKEKIAKLKMYGEPPPLGKIHIVNKSKNAGSAYKSPLSSNFARVKNVDDSPITTNKLLQRSPVLSLNKTFTVKSGMNPVKLNFSSTSSDDKIGTNPFEEEFEASPPLSLD